MRFFLLLLFFLSATHEASAHAVPQGAGAVAAGFLHPYWLPSHLLNLAGLGLLIGQSGARKYLAVAIFGGSVLCGLGATARVYESPTAIWLPVSAAVIGLLVASAWRLPRLALSAIAAVIGAMVGLDSRPETPFLSDALLAFAGTALGASLAVLIVAFAASFARARWQEIGVRVVGSWIAATAILVSALQFAR